MNLTDSVIIPREDFLELQTAAFDRPPTSVGHRLGTTAQNFAFFAFASAAVTASAWGWAKAMDYLEQKDFERKQADPEWKKTTRNPLY